MQMIGEQLIAAPCQRVWEALNDPDILAASLPGHQHLEKEADDRFLATVEVKVGPIGARLKGSVVLTDLNPPNSYTLLLEGNAGIAGSVKGHAKVKLTETDGGTLVNYAVDAQVGGRMAQLGGPIIDTTAKHFAGKFFDSFGEIVSGKKIPVAAPSPAEVAAPAAIGAPMAAGGFPTAWALATFIAAAVGFLFGHGANMTDSAWAGLAIGLLLLLVAFTAFEYGRRSAAPVVTLDSALLRRLIEGEKP
ncbi:MAG: carbon monoxide dehydrogenase subunit G [Halioglobus sp.]|nr:carbon monoxide dehydrogenase subunit G [Halioglobus sp.]